MTPASTTPDETGDHDKDKDPKDIAEKPVCYCNWNRANCPDCKKGWMEEIQAGRAPKLGHSSKLAVCLK